MSLNSFDARDRLVVDGETYEIYRLDRFASARRLPYSMKVLLENLLRNEDGQQDFTGVPCVVDLVSGNRNFEGRIHPETTMNFLASPPLVIAYALTGTMLTDLRHDPLGTGVDGQPVYLRDIWPSTHEIQEVIDECVRAEMFTRDYADVFAGDDNWRSLDIAEGPVFSWNPTSTYVRRPPYFDGMRGDPGLVRDITGARALAVLGDSLTTDHISPAGTIKADGPAGNYLTAHEVARGDFNSYGSRRGNPEVMIRGTFANIRVRLGVLAGLGRQRHPAARRESGPGQLARCGRMPSRRGDRAGRGHGG